jgi:hypothetical protein
MAVTDEHGEKRIKDASEEIIGESLALLKTRFPEVAGERFCQLHVCIMTEIAAQVVRGYISLRTKMKEKS